MHSTVTPEPDLRGLRVRLRQKHPIVLDVAFECEAGELLALVGPSGSGKTTVLRCIAGLATPRDGDVTCNGETWLDMRAGAFASPQQRRVGLVFQQYALFPHLDALANVATAMSHLPRGARAGRARALLARVNMEGLEARRPSELSGGQRQRVALARALARDPQALLLDEPFSAVDQLTRRRLRLELAQLRREIRIPMVLVTHDLDEAQLLGDRLSVLHHGRTLQTGNVPEVMNHPASALVARLLDQRNVFTGVISRHDRDREERHGSTGPAPGSSARSPTRFAPGERVAWLLPESHVVMHRRERPSRGEHENPVRGIARDVVILGGGCPRDPRLGGRGHPAHLRGLRARCGKKPGCGRRRGVRIAACGRHPSDAGGGRGALNFEVSAHVAARNRVAAQAEVSVSLLASGIHLMPASDAGH